MQAIWKCLFSMLFICKDGVFGANMSDILMTTEPVYAVAVVASELLDDLSDCRTQLDTFREAINNQSPWSLKMLDASGKPKPGFFYGNKLWLGAKSQCFDLNKGNTNTHVPPFKVNYLAAHVQFNQLFENDTKTIVLGMCLPDVCTPGELRITLENIFENRNLMLTHLYGLNYTLVDVTNLKVDYRHLMNWESIAIGIIVLMTVIMMTIGTSYDVILYQKKLMIENTAKENGKRGSAVVSKTSKEEKEGIFRQIVLCFSIITNTKLLFNTNEGPDSIPVLHGLKFISMVWIIMLHQFASIGDCFSNNNNGYRSPLANVVCQGSLGVDTFFFSSGFLVIYGIYVREIKKNLKTTFSFRLLFEAIYHRFIRLSPAYLATLYIVYYFSSYITETTDLFMAYDRPQVTCKKYWWRNMLYISNLFNFDGMCATWTWYLSNDMQFFVIGQILGICSLTYFYASAAVWSGLLIMTIATSGLISYYYNITYAVQKLFVTRDILYKQPFTRIGPYLVGMAMAYGLIRMKKRCDKKITAQWILWILTIVTLFGIIYINQVRNLPLFAAMIYIGMGKSIWGLAIGWIVFACSTGHGGLINTFLSSKIFVPLSRLSYCAYLIHPVIIHVLHFDPDVLMHGYMMRQFSSALGFIVVTIIASYIFYLMFEFPYRSLLRISTKPSGKRC